MVGTVAVATGSGRPKRAGRRWWIAIVAGALFLPRASVAEPRVEGELALESRLVAPCCWTQTLDMHDSPISTQLRAEVRSRLSRGEPASAIEADLVARFGERIRAQPPGNPLRRLALYVSIAGVVAGIGVWLALWRWKNRGAAMDGAPVLGTAPRDEWDDRLDEELARDE